MKLKFKIPFKKKKISTIPTDEDMVEASERIGTYPLLISNEDIQALVTKKFMTDKGVQLHPAKFLNEVISYIEKSEPKTKEEFIVYMKQKMASIVVPPKLLKKSRFSLFKKHS